MNRKAYFLNKECYIGIKNPLQYQKLQHVLECYLSALTQPRDRFDCRVDDTLFKVGPEIRCSRASSRYCCYGNHTAGSKPM